MSGREGKRLRGLAAMFWYPEKGSIVGNAEVDISYLLLRQMHETARKGDGGPRSIPKPIMMIILGVRIKEGKGRRGRAGEECKEKKR